MTLFLALFIIIEIGFAILLFNAGQVLWNIDSVAVRFQKYRMDPASHNLTEDWFLGWKFLSGQKMTEWMLKSFGDKFLTNFYRFTGGFYFVASPLFILAAFIHLRLMFLIG